MPPRNLFHLRFSALESPVLRDGLGFHNRFCHRRNVRGTLEKSNEEKQNLGFDGAWKPAAAAPLEP